MMNNELYHRGTPHDGETPHSGRYPYGSGKNPGQHIISEAATIKQYQNNGITSETELVQLMGYKNVRELRNTLSLAKEMNKRSDYNKVMNYLKEHPDASNADIAEYALGLPRTSESTVRNIRNPKTSAKLQLTDMTKGRIQDLLDEGKYVDIGKGCSELMMVGQQTLTNAVNLLEAEGYTKFTNITVPQVTNPGKKTTLQVLAPKGTEYKDVMKNIGNIVLPQTSYIYNSDNERTAYGMEKPVSVDSSRIYVRYAEDGGLDKDGLIEIRRGTEDLTLGNHKYAQVRIGVDDKGYMKGMAIYSDNVPDGYDIVYNVHRSEGTPLFEYAGYKGETVFKSMKTLADDAEEIDWDNPFGALLKTEDGIIVGQIHYTDKNGEDKLSPINLIKASGDWDKYSKTLSSQFLSKQPIEIINKQLNKTYADAKEEYDSIKVLNNAEVKKSLLTSFADDCDASAIHLKAASLPGQATKVLLPLENIKDDQIFAPTYDNGSQVILVRYPHEGTFQIPKLTVNNNNKDGIKTIGKDAGDAVGINSSVASQLSGADFDGDTVMVLPYADANGNIINKFSYSQLLEGLEGYDPQAAYPYREGMKIMQNTNLEMGKISNLITDMTIQGATADELARAVRHSMVVIDAKKHKLDYQTSYKENQIAALKTKYQGSAQAGAGTVISSAKSPVEVLDRKEKTTMQVRTDEEELYLLENKDKYDSLSAYEKSRYDRIMAKLTPTEYQQKLEGNKIYVNTGATSKKKVVDKETGEVTWVEVPKTIEISKMESTDDAFTLVSETPNKKGRLKEEAYANYANKMKDLAKEARVEILNTEKSSYSREAAKIYASEVSSINNKYEAALTNSPRERSAQIYANVVVSNKLKSNPSLKDDKKIVKKIKQQAITEGRLRTGAKRQNVTFTDSEWEAVQAGAISSSRLTELLKKADMDQVKKLATPKSSSQELTATQIARIKSLYSHGATIYDIASQLGISTSTVSSYLY